MMYNPVELPEWDTYSTPDCQNTGVNFNNNPGKIGGWFFVNNAASTRYVKIYDTAGIPNPASDIPKLVIPIPPASDSKFALGGAIKFALGIAIRCCTGAANTDNTAPTTNDVAVNVFYK